MSKFIRTTALAGTFAAAAFMAATPAAAVNATSNATATARVIKPLTLVSKQNLDLGTIVLVNSSAFNATVGIDKAGVWNCDGGSTTNITCSGPHQFAIYTVTGTNGQKVNVAAGPVTMNGSNGGTLTLTPSFDSVLTLTNSGSGMDFNVGGSISVADSTIDGLYTGNFAVTADYQ